MVTTTCRVLVILWTFFALVVGTLSCAVVQQDTGVGQHPEVALSPWAWSPGLHFILLALVWALPAAAIAAIGILFQRTPLRSPDTPPPSHKARTLKVPPA